MQRIFEAPSDFKSCSSETAKYRHLVACYCDGCGVDIASQGDRVVPWAVSFDLPAPEFAFYCSNQPAKGPIHLRGHATALPFESNSLNFVYCLPPNEIVHTPTGNVPISSVKIGDFVLGATGFTKVIGTLKRAFNGSIISLKTSKGRLEVTENHPIATPAGWTCADQLRESSIIIHPSPQVEFSKLRNGTQIFGGVGGRFQMPSSRSIAAGVAESDSSLAILNHNACLGLFGVKKRINKRQKIQDFGCIALEENSVSRFSPRMPRLKCAIIDSELNAMNKRNFFGAEQYPKIAIGNLDSWSNASLRRKAETYAALSINYSSQPCEQQIRLGSVQCVSKHTYNGDVFNLKTEDHTFYANNILTHNCSHLLEDYLDWEPVLKEWVRVLQPGGKLIILVPDKVLWNEAIARGQPPNCSHKHEAYAGELSTYAARIGVRVLYDELTKQFEGDYSILFIGLKL